MPFGILDTQYIDFPAGVDTAYLRGLVTRAGVRFPRILEEIDDRLAALNSGLDPLLAALIAPTTEAYAEVAAPVAFQITERAEYTLARPQLVEGQAHMLPLRGYDVSLEFTEDGLNAMSLPRIMANVDSVLLGYRRLYRLEVLKRLFSNAQVRVATKTTVTSPGFAGSGTGDNVFSRPYPDGTALPGGYTHYYVANTSNAGELETVIEAAIARLGRWQRGPFEMLAGSALLPLVQALDGFTRAGSALVRLSPNDAEALVEAQTYAGVYTSDEGIDVRVRRAEEDVPANHLAIYKSYGALDAMNPLAWRYDEQKGRRAYVRYRSLFPLDQAVVLQDFGIGVNNRTAVALVYAAAGAASYTNPTW